MIRSNKWGEKSCSVLAGVISPGGNLLLVECVALHTRLPGFWSIGGPGSVWFQTSLAKIGLWPREFSKVKRETLWGHLIKRFSFNILHWRESPPNERTCGESKHKEKYVNNKLWFKRHCSLVYLMVFVLSVSPTKFCKNTKETQPWSSIKLIWWVC